MAEAHAGGEEEEECSRPAQILKTSQDNEARGRTKSQKSSKIKKYRPLCFELQAQAEALGRWSGCLVEGISSSVSLKGPWVSRRVQRRPQLPRSGCLDSVGGPSPRCHPMIRDLASKFHFALKVPQWTDPAILSKTFGTS